MDLVVDTGAPNCVFYTGDITKASLSCICCKQFVEKEIQEQESQYALKKYCLGPKRENSVG